MFGLCHRLVLPSAKFVLAGIIASSIGCSGQLAKTAMPLQNPRNTAAVLKIDDKSYHSVGLIPIGEVPTGSRTSQHVDEFRNCVSWKCLHVIDGADVYEFTIDYTSSKGVVREQRSVKYLGGEMLILDDTNIQVMILPQMPEE